MRRFRKRNLFLTAAGCLLTTFSTGCQCTRMTDCYSNIIDDISDHEGHMDDCYCACFDLTRIGYADWRACRCNRIWCRKCTEKQCHYCESYPYGAVFPSNPYQPGAERAFESKVPPVPAPEPPLPQPDLTEPPAPQ